MVGRIPVMDVHPVVDLGRLPAKATVGEPFPVSATIFREGHDKLGAEVVLTSPTGERRPPVRMVKQTDPVDRYLAWVTPDSARRVDLRGPRVVRPGRHVAARRRHQDPGRDRRRADVHRGPAAARAGARRRSPPAPTRRSSTARIAAATDTARPAEARLAQLQADDVTRVLAAHPLRELLTVAGPFPAYADRERALFGSWYEFFPRSEGAVLDEATGKVTSGTFAHRGRAARGRGRDGLRRHLPAADPPDRRGQPQGTQQHPDPRPRRPRLAVGDRQQGRRPRRHPPRPRRLRRLRRLRGARRRARPRGRARPRAAGRARPPVGDQQPGVVHHPRRRHDRLRREPARRSTRTSTPSTSTTTRPASAARCCGSCGSG